MENGNGKWVLNQSEIEADTCVVYLSRWILMKIMKKRTEFHIHITQVIFLYMRKIISIESFFRDAWEGFFFLFSLLFVYLELFYVWHTELKCGIKNEEYCQQCGIESTETCSISVCCTRKNKQIRTNFISWCSLNGRRSKRIEAATEQTTNERKKNKFKLKELIWNGSVIHIFHWIDNSYNKKRQVFNGEVCWWCQRYQIHSIFKKNRAKKRRKYRNAWKFNVRK